MDATRSIELKHDHSDAQGECLSSSGQFHRASLPANRQECTQIPPRECHIVPDFGLMFHIVLTGQQSLVGLDFVAITRKHNPSQTLSSG